MCQIQTKVEKKAELTRYCVIDDELFIQSHDRFYKAVFNKICLLFSPKARDADFLLYSAYDTIFPNPFTSVDDVIPGNRNEIMNDCK